MLWYYEFHYAHILFCELLKTSASLEEKGRGKGKPINERLQKESIKVWRNLGGLRCLGSA